MRFANINSALLGLLGAIHEDGREVATRGSLTREVGPIQFTIEHPTERCLILAHRNNNIFASIAETMWVLAGRNDLEFLAHYLPRAADFSDDGETWRAAYGPRLRDWNGVDQIDEVRRILLADPTSRRAVASIFDPAQDYVDSKDIPCNNWLHFMVRDDVLNAHVAVRSNDAIWGFSGINAFEWSVLLEILAHWVGVGVGQLTFSVSSAHVYERHFDRAERISASSGTGADVYSSGGLKEWKFRTSWADFPDATRTWFDAEEAIRHGEDAERHIEGASDPLLQAFLRMISFYWAAKRGASHEELLGIVAPLAGSDLGEAALEYASRQRQDFPQYVYPSSAQDSNASCNRTSEAGTATASSPVVVDESVHAFLNELISLVTTLHAGKTLAYGDSWKRRGELIGIMANIARKVDRLQIVATSVIGQDSDESALDTAVDLLVYSVKYSTYLMDTGEIATPGPLRDLAAGPFSDGLDGFDWVLRDLVTSKEQSWAPAHTCVPRVQEAVTHVQEAYDALEAKVRATRAGGPNKAELVGALSRRALQLVLAIVDAAPESYERLGRSLRGGVETVSRAERVPSDQEAREARERQAAYFAEHNARRRFSYE